MDRTTLKKWVIDARASTLALVRDLSDEQFRPPLLRTINPFLWEIGHAAYFHEYWVLRHAAGLTPLVPNPDALYDSAKIPHDTRWDLPLPSRPATIDYIEAVRDRVLDRIDSEDLGERDIYFILLSVFHEDMHDEAFTITRQTLGYPLPVNAGNADYSSGPHPGDVTVPGGTFTIGSTAGAGFIFDNEKWAHTVEIPAFRIARAPVTQSEYANFLDATGAKHPGYWKRDPQGGWLRRHFDRWVPIEPHRPVANISWFEADAYCQWAGRRLPTEFEWEVAATGSNRSSANLDWSAGGCCDVASFANGDSIYGCRQMIGNVWEWTSSDFLPYEGFSEDPYKEYSSPWFRTHKTLRGGAWSTRSRLIRTAYRNFYTPDRRDIWAGFRTCAL